MIVNRSKNAMQDRKNDDNGDLDPATLLARGFTARWLGFVTPAGNKGRTATSSFLANSTPKKSALQGLSNDEIDKDLRHMQAFWEASQRYHQHYYAQLNRITSAPISAAAVSPAAAQHPPPRTLPVRLDPDHDKRLQAQRKQMARAEVMREALELQYVAVRAHYVEVCQAVQQEKHASQERVQALQSTAMALSKQLAAARARLQIHRDILSALNHRLSILQTSPGDAAPTGGDALAPTTASSHHEDPLLAVWMEMEQASNDLPAPGTKKKSSSSSSQQSRVVLVVPWPALTQPSTPPGVPLLVSAASCVPEKSLAWAVDDSGNQDSIWSRPTALKKDAMMAHHSTNSALVWPPNHLPRTVLQDEEEDEANEAPEGSVTPKDTANDTSDDSSSQPPVRAAEISVAANHQPSDDTALVNDLRAEVAWLEQQLAAECQANAVCVSETAVGRHKLDEWTTMMALVRQETEAVLYRHNVLLEHPMVAEKAEEYWKAAAPHEPQLQAGQALDEQPDTSAQAPVHGTEDTGVSDDAVPLEIQQGGDGDREDNANDGDDEGDDETETWARKRSATAAEEVQGSPNSRKRRRL